MSVIRDKTVGVTFVDALGFRGPFAAAFAELEVAA